MGSITEGNARQPPIELAPYPKFARRLHKDEDNSADELATSYRYIQSAYQKTECHHDGEPASYR